MTYRRLALAVVLLGILAWTSKTSTADTPLVSRGSVWRYLDNGTFPGSTWRTLGFNDGAWKVGAAELGYGDGDEDTIVSYGPNSSAKYITTYFRQTFQVANPAELQSMTLRLLRDDGAVVYLNNTEVFRSNMPGGTVSHTTLAVSAIDDANFHMASINPSLLVAGSNVLAVEIHQANGTSSDISFDAELLGSTTVSVTRGPYLQMGNDTSVVVRWRTNGATNSQVRYGTSPESLSEVATSATVTTEHEVRLTNLAPQTTYYYSVGSIAEVLAGGDPEHVFSTAPAPGSATATRVWVLGDSGTADANARAVRDAYYSVAGSTRPSLWLMLGDNAYESGLDSEYQNAVFDMYPATLRQSVLWPTLGNHDGAAANSSTQSGPYYDMFTLPKNGEAGGLASGTEAYYSFDYGNIHFICLESFETSRAASSPMLTWLANDLASTSQQWIVAYFHHPPYSKGSHDSDVDLEMREMRQNALPILEEGGVDLVLTGHSHSYERSFLIDGHYGQSSSFTASMKKDGGSGRESGTGAYQKPADTAAHAGAVYTVAGSSGKVSGGTFNHPAMFVSMSVLGSIVLDVNGARLDARFIDNLGAVRDSFTMIKSSAPAPPPTIQTAAVPNATVGVAYSTTLVASGGVQPYTWSLDGGSLPTGLTLSAAGVISGTPSGTPGLSSFTARVRAADGQFATRAFTLQVVAAPTPPPGAFSKTAPKNNAKNTATALTLSWAASANATSYEYCYDTTNDNACSTWISTGTARTANISGLTVKGNYYWQVRAVNVQGQTPANAGAWWRFTTGR
jgi:hypothetical protein